MTRENKSQKIVVSLETLNVSLWRTSQIVNSETIEKWGLPKLLCKKNINSTVKRMSKRLKSIEK